MKTSQDPRHLNRVKAIKELFTWEFTAGSQPKNKLANAVIRRLPAIDQAIKKAAPAWPIEQINKIDLAILRLAVFELIIEKKAPYKVVTDEAVELAKEFGSELSPGFINGALGNIITDYNLEND